MKYINTPASLAAYERAKAKLSQVRLNIKANFQF